MEIKNVYINNKKTGLVVDGFDIQTDSIYLSVHREEDEFKNMMAKIGDPNLKATKHIKNNIIKILQSKPEWTVSNISFNFGCVTFDLEAPAAVTFMDVASQLGISCDRDDPSVIPLRKVSESCHGLSHYTLEKWTYFIDCREEYRKPKRVWPGEVLDGHKKDIFGGRIFGS